MSYNRYGYVLNNPLRFTDPSGYFASGDTTGTQQGNAESIFIRKERADQQKERLSYNTDESTDGPGVNQLQVEGENGQDGGGELQLNSTASYIYDGQFKSYPLLHSMEAGQHVRVEVKNMNILGVQLDLQDKSRYTYEKNWLGIVSKVYTGDSHSMVLFPGQSRSFDFYMFNYVPMNWQFELSTKISGAANVQIRFYSDWILGMPYDPNRPNR